MSTNGETRVEGIVDDKGNPIASPTVATDTDLIDEIQEQRTEATTTIDPRRMSSSLLIYNFIRSTVTETSLDQQLQQVAFIKKQKQHVGDMPGETQIRQMLENCRAHRTILAHTINDRFKDFDAAYWARAEVEPYSPPPIEAAYTVDESDEEATTPA